jgi:hypothetical protein
MEIPCIPGEYGIMDHTVREACVLVYKTHGDSWRWGGGGRRNVYELCFKLESEVTELY